MAWVDDRIWCHPKFADISDRAFRVYVNGISYSAGFGCKGMLTTGQQKTIGSDAKVRRELVGAHLWDEGDAQAVLIHDWEEHNGKRDERREKDRVRKKSARASAGTSAGQSNGASAGTARVDGSEGSEGSEKRSSTTRPVGSIPDETATAAEMLLWTIRPKFKDDGTRKVVFTLADEVGVDGVKEVLSALKVAQADGSVRHDAKYVVEALGKRARKKAAA